MSGETANIASGYTREFVLGIWFAPVIRRRTMGGLEDVPQVMR